MVSMSARSVRQATGPTGPAKITIIQDKEDTFEESKENILNCSLYSMFESHLETANMPVEANKGTGDGKRGRSALQPRKRSLNEAQSGPTRELTPPELTTSDNFKPAKRIVGPKLAVAEGKKRLLPIKTSVSPAARAPSPAMNASKLGTPSEARKRESMGSTSRRDSTKRASSLGRRMSVVRVSLAREKGGLLSLKKETVSSSKKVERTPLSAPKEMMFSTKKGQRSSLGSLKDMVFSAKKIERPSLSGKKDPAFSAKKTEQPPASIQKEVEKARLRVLERKASLGTSSSSKLPATSGRPSSVLSRATSSDTPVDEPAKSRAIARQSSTIKLQTENIRSHKLSIVLQNEQRLQEKNEQYELQLRQLQEQLVEKDHEIERLRSAGLILNNLVNSQSDEVRELKFRLKETFNENSEVRDVCEKLEKERQDAHDSAKLAKEQQETSRALEKQLALLTSQLMNMGVSQAQLSMKSSRSEDHEGGVEGQPGPAHDVVPSESTSGEEVLPSLLMGCLNVASRIKEDYLQNLKPLEICSPRESEEDSDETESSPPRPSVQWSVASEQEVPVVGNHEEFQSAIRSLQDVVEREGNTTMDPMPHEFHVEVPVIGNHDDVQFAIQDLQEIVMQEEAQLRDRCADALKVLDLQLTPLLNSRGVLDLDSLKALILTASSWGNDFCTQRFNSIFRF